MQCSVDFEHSNIHQLLTGTLFMAIAWWASVTLSREEKTTHENGGHASIEGLEHKQAVAQVLKEGLAATLTMRDERAAPASAKKPQCSSRNPPLRIVAHAPIGTRTHRHTTTM